MDNSHIIQDMQSLFVSGHGHTLVGLSDKRETFHRIQGITIQMNLLSLGMPLTTMIIPCNE